MFNHEPANYKCPYCAVLRGEYDQKTQPEDIIYETNLSLAKIAPRWWAHNPGGALVVPKHHYENLYDIPDDVLADVYQVAKKVAIAMRHTLKCQGVSTRQHNEPVGDQEIWHLHVHVFPRYPDDNLYQNHDNHNYVDATMRAPYAEKLRTYLQKLQAG